MNTIQKTYELGQSIWLDYIRRSFITSGELGTLIDMGVTGMTSNPTIFEKAITGSPDYDLSLTKLRENGSSSWEIYDELTREDVGTAADLLLPVYERTGALDGYVSLEVNPGLARDTEGTVREGKRLFSSLGRPNIMIKVPATEEGIPAIEQLIGDGVNVNVTLIFSLDQYRHAAKAYKEGIRQRVAQRQPVDTVVSVASFFLSRIDTAVDQLIQNSGSFELLGRTAITSAKLAYAEFNRIFSGKDWEDLTRSGARLQRVLWASTSTKNPGYPDTLYVDGLVGPNTINTLPMETLRAFLDHGKPSADLSNNLADATRHMDQLERIGIDLGKINRDLLEKGVKSFADSFASLLSGIGRKTAHLESGRTSFYIKPSRYREKYEKALEDIRVGGVINRIWEHDHTLWKKEPDEISNRLGWLNSPVNMKGVVGQIRHTVEAVRMDNYTDVLLLGMGGSSLAPDLFRKTFKTLNGFLNLKVLDTTDPSAVGDQAESLDLAKTLFVVSSKSGSTIETLSHFRYFFNLLMSKVGKSEAGKHFVAVTDPGSPLASLASDLGFRKVFLNDPDIGGRFSALSCFGLVPAALMGINIDLLLDRAAVMASNCAPSISPVQEDNSGASLGAIMGALHNCGVNKLTFITSPPVASLGAWLEQLLAESTGKEGKGIVPVDGEFPGRPDFYGTDRLFAYIRLSGDTTFDHHVKDLEEAGYPVVAMELADLYDLGAEFFRWEFATAVAGHIMGINPFNQPDVESAKIQARSMIREYQDAGHLPVSDPALVDHGVEVYAEFKPDSLADALVTFLGQMQKGDYVALQAYVCPTPETSRLLEEFRHRIRDHYKVATTLGFGPRFLHSTGQLHKGGENRGLFIQITSEDSVDLPVPDEAGRDGSTITFGVLKAAQAMGDLRALVEAGRRVIRFHMKGNVTEGIETLMGTLV